MGLATEEGPAMVLGSVRLLRRPLQLIRHLRTRSTMQAMHIRERSSYLIFLRDP